MATPPLIYVLNGPNLNLLGSGDARLFGAQTLDEIGATLAERAKSLGLKVEIRQSNHEGQLVDWLQEEHGPVTGDERAAALKELDELDVEHERRRTAGKHNAGEAA